jgi:hypothetical protein
MKLKKHDQSLNALSFIDAVVALVEDGAARLNVLDEKRRGGPSENHLNGPRRTAASRSTTQSSGRTLTAMSSTLATPLAL